MVGNTGLMYHPRLEDVMQAFERSSFIGETVGLSKLTQMNGAQDCHFTDCEVILDPKGLPGIGREGARFWFTRCVFERCRVVVKGKVRALRLSNHVRLVGCTLLGGPLIEPVLGVGPMQADSVPESERPITDCDFTGVELRDALFHRVAWNEVRLPGWPHVSVLAQEGSKVFAPASPVMPARTVLVDQVKDYDWGSDDMKIAMTSLVFGVGVRFNERQIQVCHAETLAERARASVDDVRAALDRFAHPAIRY